MNFLHSTIYAAMACAALAGCASPQPAANPFEGAPGVLGSMAQARPAPAAAEEAPAAAQADPRSAQAAAESAQSRAALQAAEDTYARGDWPGAAQQFRQLTATYPRNAQLWFGYGAASALAGNLDEAAAGFDAVLRLDGNDVRAAYNLALVRLSQADMALNRASLNQGGAPGQVRGEITQLRNDLAPLFGRRPQMAQAGGTQESGARIQDPTRAAQGASPSPAQMLLSRPGGAVTAP
ncbi:tetratricopeptide repeat protein [Comamonas composti]|uniref:tetratricopeptide repeat protein n=1 Tax=Comamonas composti TaxID=408558 RepID=UPI0004167C0E|nr:tetratricopeptide repeat protein [Comamonas composti]